MKKSKILYAIYCVLVLLAVAGILIFRDKLFNLGAKDVPQTEIEEEIVEEQPTNPTEPVNPPTQDVEPGEEKYATGLNLLCPTVLEISIGDMLLLTNYLSVVPSKFLNDVECKVRNSTNINFNYETGEVSAYEEGEYYIDFCVASGETTKITKTLQINVVNKESLTAIQQNISCFNVGDSVSFNSVFTCGEEFDISISDDAVLSFENGKFIAKSEGEVDVCLQVYSEFVTYAYNTTINVVPLEFEYKILFTQSVDGKLTKNDMFSLNYNLYYGEELAECQDLDFTYSVEGVVRAVSTNPFIVFNKLGVGECEVNIYVHNTNILVATILIEFTN